MRFKVGNIVRIQNSIFPVCGCKGKIVDISGKLISVEMKRLNRKIDESPMVTHMYYSRDLALVS